MKNSRHWKCSATDTQNFMDGQSYQESGYAKNGERSRNNFGLKCRT